MNARTLLPLTLLVFGCAARAKGPTIVAPQPQAASIAPRPPSIDHRTRERAIPEVKIAWPVFTLDDEQASAVVNDAIAKALHREEDSFVSQYGEARRQGNADLPEATLQWTLELDCRESLVTESIVSVWCSEYAYTGGAHGMSEGSAFNFAIAGSETRTLQLNELLRDGARPQLADACIEDLKEQEASYALDGTLTTANVSDLLDAFRIEKSGLIFYFAPYATGCYAEGSREVTLTWAELAPLARPGGVLDRMMR